METEHPPESRLKPAPYPCNGIVGLSLHPPGFGRCPARAFEEMSWAPKSCCYVRCGRTWDHLTGAEPYGDGGPAVVAGVTSGQGGRESRPQGQGGQVIGHLRIVRYAKCRAPKRCWVSCVNEADAVCLWMRSTGSCSTQSCICWPTDVSTPTRGQ